jgi:hypothetical protein
MASFLEKKYLDNNTLEYMFRDLTHQICCSCHELH